MPSGGVQQPLAGTLRHASADAAARWAQQRSHVFNQGKAEPLLAAVSTRIKAKLLAASLSTFPWARLATPRFRPRCRAWCKRPRGEAADR